MVRRPRKSIVVLGVFTVSIALLFTLMEGHSADVSAGPKVLSLSSWIPLKLNPEKDAWAQMAKDLEEATGGKYTIKVFDAQTLGKAKEHYDLVVKGIADIGYVLVGFTPGRFPITDLVSYSSAPSSEAYTKGMLELMKAGYMDKEFSKVKNLHVFSGSPSSFLWRKGVKPATSLADFKGRKIRVPSTGAADLVTAIGASPVAIPMPEVYTALERGVVDGVLTSINVLLVFHLKDVSEGITRINMPTFGFSMVMNRNTWNNLPEAGRAVLEKNKEKYAMMSSRGHDNWDANTLKQVNPKFYDLPASEIKKIKELFAPALKAYVAKYEAAGYPAKAAARLLYQSIKKGYGVEPFVLPK